MNDTLSVEAITELVRERRNAEATIAIRQLLRTNSDPNLMFRVCEWYFAMGRLRDAFLHLRLYEGFPARQAADTFDGRRLLWGARFLNNMGASLFALELARQVEPSNSEHHWILANIYHSNRYDQEAIEHFNKMVEHEANPDGRFERFRQMVRANALAALKRFDEALQVIGAAYSRTSEPALQGHMQSFWGGILVQAGQYKEALPILLESEKKLAFIEDLPDFGILCKHLGLAYGKLGELETAERYFERSQKILFSSALRPETWLDLLHHKQEVLPVPRLWVDRKIHYPGHTPGIQAYFGEKKPLLFGTSSARIQVMIESDEYRVGGQWKLGIPKELLLLGYLRIVGDWGINAIRVQALLWPSEVFSFAQLSERLKKLVRRLKTRYQLEIVMRDGHLTLAPSSLDEVGVLSGGESQPELLRARTELRLSDLEAAYAVSKSQASLYLQRWISNGILTKQGTGRNTRYFVGPPPPISSSGKRD